MVIVCGRFKMMSILTYELALNFVFHFLNEIKSLMEPMSCRLLVLQPVSPEALFRAKCSTERERYLVYPSFS